MSMFDRPTPSLRFAVFARAIPKGSMRFVPHAKTGKPVYKPNPKLEAWEARVKTVATIAAQKVKADGVRAWPTSEPVRIKIDFHFERPKKHHIAGDRSNLVRENAPTYCSTTAQGDIDKLTRAVLDGLTGPILNDDAVVSIVYATKRYDSADRVGIMVELLTE